MQLLNLLAALAIVVQTPGGVFESDLWPGEGRPEFQAGANELIIREAPSKSARIARRAGVTKGQKITFDETRFRTVQAGHLQVLAAGTVTGRVLGRIGRLTRDAYYHGRFPERAVPLKKGDVIEYLQYRAEGTCFVRVASQVMDADPCPVEDERRVQAVTQPRTEWWIRIVVNSVPAGWVIVDGKAVRLIGRSF